MRNTLKRCKQFESFVGVENNWFDELRETAHKQRLAKQQQDTEASLAKHVEFIDKLVAEKAELANKCQDIISSSKQIERRWQEKVIASA